MRYKEYYPVYPVEGNTTPFTPLRVNVDKGGIMGRRHDGKMGRWEDGKMDCMIDLADCGGLWWIWRIVVDSARFGGLWNED